MRAFRFGVIDYLSKPFTRETLVRKVARILEGRSRRPGAFALEPDEAGFRGGPRSTPWLPRRSREARRS